jgi:hypothetical protein
MTSNIDAAARRVVGKTIGECTAADLDRIIAAGQAPVDMGNLALSIRPAAATPTADMLGSSSATLAALRDLVTEYKRLPDRLLTTARNAGVPMVLVGAHA